MILISPRSLGGQRRFVGVSQLSKPYDPADLFHPASLALKSVGKYSLSSLTNLIDLPEATCVNYFPISGGSGVLLSE